MAAAGPLGALSQLGNASVGYGIGKAQIGDAFNDWKKRLKRGPRYTAIGLERAGINRILAAGGGIGATNAQGALQKIPNISSGNPASDAAQQGQATQAKQLLRAQTRIADAQAVREEYLAWYYTTPAGMAALRSTAMKEGNPSTWPGIASMLGRGTIDTMGQIGRGRSGPAADGPTNAKNVGQGYSPWRMPGGAPTGEQIHTLEIKPKAWYMR